uniref:Nucleolar protein 6 n=1 Tax=Chrysotila carterae TaxID=13221 RepID=A0A7S4BKK4_CHRCT
MGKKRSRTSSVPSHKEIAAYSETELLYKSNLFKLQTEELVRAISPTYGIAPQESALRTLRETVLGLPESRVEWEAPAKAGGKPKVSHPELSRLRLSNQHVHFEWKPPQQVDVVGSYLLRTCVRPSLNIDLAITIPPSCLLQKDYLDYRYTDKRMLYIAHLAHLLKGAEGVAGTPRFCYLPHLQDARWPALELELAIPAATGRAAETWQIRLIPCLAANALEASKLKPSRANIRNNREAASAEAWPSAEYNNTLALESAYASALALLHSYLAKDSSGAFREAIMLFKVWLRKRFGEQAGSPTAFQLSLLMLHLLRERKLTFAMGSYNILRVTLSYLASTDLCATPIVLPSAPTDDSKNDSNGKHDASCGLTQPFRPFFAWVMLDARGLCNFGAGVGVGAMRELQIEAAQSLSALNSRGLDDAEVFGSLFVAPLSPQLRYDTVLTFKPPADGPLAGSVFAENLLRAASKADAAAAQATKAAESAANGTAATGTSARKATSFECAPTVVAGGSPYAACATAAEALLAAGMARRAQLVRCWCAPLEPVPLGKTLGQTAGNNGGGGGDGGGQLHAGLLLDAHFATGLVDRGPTPGSEGVGAWTALWGERSETRRFKDGAIVHAVVWPLPAEGRHMMPVVIARDLLLRHLRVSASVSGLGGLGALLSARDTGLSSSTSPQIIAAFEKLSSKLRKLSDLPLMITSISSLGAVFSFTEEFPPPAVPTGQSPPIGAPVPQFVVQFESTGKWPDDPVAIAALKTAFYLKMAAALEEQAGLFCQPTREALYVQCDGFTFSGTIAHDKEERLLLDAGKLAAAKELLRRTSSGVRHTTLAHEIAAQHPAFGGSVRLAKRWINCQMLSGLLQPQLVELLVARAFCSDAERPPNSELLGFMRFLRLLSLHYFQQEPLLIGVDSVMDAELRASAVSAFNASREAAGGGADVWVATPLEPKGSIWCEENNAPAVFRRLCRLAGSALSCLEEAAVPSLAVATDDTLASKMLQAFVPALEDFDALLMLDARRVPRRHLAIGNVADADDDRAADASNVDHGRIAPRSSEHDVAELVRTLRERYSGRALFFYDQNGSNVIAIKWRPRSFMPAPMRPARAQDCLHLTRAKAQAASGASASWLLPNAPFLLEEMRVAARALRASVCIVRSARHLNAAHD